MSGPTNGSAERGFPAVSSHSPSGRIGTAGDRARRLFPPVAPPAAASAPPRASTGTPPPA